MLTVQILSTIVALSFQTNEKMSRGNRKEKMKELSKVESETKFGKLQIEMITPDIHLKRLFFILCFV